MYLKHDCNAPYQFDTVFLSAGLEADVIKETTYGTQVMIGGYKFYIPKELLTDKKWKTWITRHI